MIKDREDENIQDDDFSTSEFDEIYDDATEFVDVDDIDISDTETSEDASDLDFIDEDIEEGFSDEDNSYEESENHLDGDDAYYDDSQNASGSAPKNKSSFGTVLAVLAVLGAGGAGAYFSGMIPGFGPGQTSPQTYQEEPPVDNGMSNVLASQQEEVPAKTADQSEMEDLFAENSTSDSDITQPVKTEPSSDMNIGFADNDANEMDMSSEEGLFEEVDKNSDEFNSFSGSDTSEELDDVMAENNFATMDNSPESKGEPNTDILGDIENLEVQLNELQGNLNSRLSDIENKLSAMPKSSGDPSSDLSSIEERLDQMSSRLDMMEKDIKSVKKLASASSSKQSSSAKATETKAATSSAKPVQRTAPKVSNKWEIRAIQVGKAVIARHGEGGTRSIVVGDEVPGLGTVKAITYKDGGWIIEGSRGSVKQ